MVLLVIEGAAMPRPRSHVHDEDPVERPAPPKLRVQPLLCPACQGAVPLADGDATPCPYCGQAVAIPPEHRALRAAEREHAVDQAEARARYAKIGKPPGPFLRVWAGAAGGVLGAVLWVIHGFLWLWVGLLRIVAEVLSHIDDFRVLLAVLLLPLGALYGLLWLLAKGLHRFAPVIGLDVIDVLSLGGAFLLFGALLYLLFPLPLAMNGYAEAFATVRRRLQACLAAMPPRTAGGPALCRSCGAALVVPRGALGVRCAYCDADNLIALSERWVSKVRGHTRTFHHKVETAISEERRVRAKASRSAWRIVLLSLLLPLLVWLLGWSMSALDLFEHRAGWRAAMAGPTRRALPHECPRGFIAGLKDAFGWGSATQAACPDALDLPLRRKERVALTARGEDATRRVVARRMGSRKPLELRWDSTGDPDTQRATFKARVSGWYVIETGTAQVKWRVSPPGAD